MSPSRRAGSTTQPPAPPTSSRALLPHPGSTPASAFTSQARNTFNTSFVRFEHTVAKICVTDHRTFASTELEDVRTAAREVEKQLAARQSLRNMRRIEPFLNGLERYSKVTEILCNGTPYLPWIWAPIKLMLQLSSEYIHAFEKLIAAYSQIAECLPRFDRLSSAIDNPDFQNVLAVIYSDILEFHRKAYKFFKRSGWRCFFNSAWGRFEGRFKCILESLSKHTDLVDREANAFLITETLQWRKETLEAAAQADKERAFSQLAAVLAWLNLENIPQCGQYNQDDIMDRLSNDCYPGTTDWVVKHPRIKAWLKHDRGQRMLWVKGKPGCGKSTLCAKLAQFLRIDQQTTILFCFYSYRVNGIYSHPSVFIMATILSQALRKHKSLSSYVYSDFVAKALSPSRQNLKQILVNIMPQLTNPRIMIDGIDECLDCEHRRNPQALNVVKDVVRDISELFSSNVTTNAKLLLPVLSMDDEKDSLRNAIRSFTSHRLTEIRGNFGGVQSPDQVFDGLEDKIVQKSQEMFLWVRLVLSHLESDVYSLNDLKTAIENLPIGLNEFYARIVNQVMNLNPHTTSRAIKILQCMLGARRNLRLGELQAALALSENNPKVTNESKLPPSVINICKPLIEVLHDRRVTFVHFTVQEYLIQSKFISPISAESAITDTCLIYLNSSLSLLDEAMTNHAKTVEVGKGFHSLQSYASDHWVDHVLTVGSHDKGGELYSSSHQHLNELWLSLTDWRNSPLSQTSQGLPEDLQSLDGRLIAFENHPHLHSMLSQIIRHRTHVLHQFENRILDVVGSADEDPTPFGQIRLTYDKRVQDLLECIELEGLSAAELDEFKSENEAFAFACRFPACSNNPNRFSTDYLRQEHEQSHTPPLLCTYTDCKYMLSFNSKDSLKRHIRENHAVASSVIPRTIRRAGGFIPLLSEQKMTSSTPRSNNFTTTGNPMTDRSTGHISCTTNDSQLIQGVRHQQGSNAVLTEELSKNDSTGFNSAHINESLTPTETMTFGQFSLPTVSTTLLTVPGIKRDNRHPVSHDPIFGCMWCESSFGTIPDLRHHEIDIHTTNSEMAISGKYPICTFCRRPFVVNEGIQRHEFLQSLLTHLSTTHALQPQGVEYIAHVTCLLFMPERKEVIQGSHEESVRVRDQRSDVNDPLYRYHAAWIETLEWTHPFLVKPKIQDPQGQSPANARLGDKSIPDPAQSNISPPTTVDTYPEAHISTLNDMDNTTTISKNAERHYPCVSCPGIRPFDNIAGLIVHEERVHKSETTSHLPKNCVFCEKESAYPIYYGVYRYLDHIKENHRQDESAKVYAYFLAHSLLPCDRMGSVSCRCNWCNINPHMTLRFKMCHEELEHAQDHGKPFPEPIECVFCGKRSAPFLNAAIYAVHLSIDHFREEYTSQLLRLLDECCGPR